MLPIWMVNYFIFIIKEFHFKTLRAKYQIPVNIPIRLSYMSKKCCYKGVESVRVYEQMLKAGLRFPLSSLHCRSFNTWVWLSPKSPQMLGRSSLAWMSYMGPCPMEHGG